MKNLLLVLFVSASQFIFGQQIALQDALPMNPLVKTGKLKNGLTYYIHKNTLPAKRAELRLVIKVGSIVETESQRGLAHFMEHMNFNGTKNFPKSELTSFLEKSGIKFGADLNAYTSFDETVYMLPIPTDTLAKLDKFVSVLADWAAFATLDPVEIDKERGVIIEEKRARKNGQMRMLEKQLPLMTNNSRYAQRIPIGLDSIILNAPFSEFKKFHKNWYRPDLQAVVAVGDFDEAALEAMIVKHFGKIKKAKKAPKREAFSIPLSGTTKVGTFTDPEQPYSIVKLTYQKPVEKVNTAQDKRKQITINLFNTLINNRLQDLTQSANPPFLFGQCSYAPSFGNVNELNVIAVAKGTDIETAMKTALDENERARQFGFLESELKRAKLGYITSLEKAVAEKSKSNSAKYVSQYVQGFLRNEVSTSEDYNLQFAKTYLEGISTQEINDLVKNLLTKENRILIVSGPEKDKDKLPTEAQLLTWLENTGNKIEAYKEEKIASSLVEKMPIAGKIKAETKIEALGVTEITFENGLKAILKPTVFKNDEIIFNGKSFGGSSLYSDEQYDNANYSSDAAALSGNGTITNTNLKKYMAGKTASVTSNVGKFTETIGGNSSQKDLETALQLVYNKFTNNNLDKEAVNGALNSQKAFLESTEKTKTPEVIFSETINQVLNPNDIRSLPMTAERTGKINANKAMSVFKERFANAADFKFTFVGNFDVEKIKPLLSTYLGSLPSNNALENFKDRGIRAPKGQVNKTVYAGKENKATLFSYMTDSYEPTPIKNLQISLLGEIINLRLNEKLREQEGGVYSPYAGGSVSIDPVPTYGIQVSFECSPDNLDKLYAITLAEIEKLKVEGPINLDIEKVLAKKKLDLETNQKTNGYWLNKLSDKYLRNMDLKEILNEEELLKQVTPANFKIAAQQFLKADNLIKVVMLPEALKK